MRLKYRSPLTDKYTEVGEVAICGTGTTADGEAIALMVDTDNFTQFATFKHGSDGGGLQMEVDEIGRRLVACYNACQGISDDALLSGVIPKAGNPIGGAAICGMSDMPIPRALLLQAINERIGWHRDNLAGWKEPDGYLVPTEPDLDERRRVRAHLMVAVEVLEELKRFLGLE